MSITFQGVPNNAAASNVFVEQEAVRRGVGGLAIPHRLLIVGQHNADKSPTANVAQLINSVDDGRDRYGRGSILALMIERAFASAGTVPIYALPVAEAGGAVKAAGSFALTGSSIGAGTLALYIAGRRIAVAVTAGQTPTQIGDAVEAAVTAALDLPVTAVNTTGTVAITAKNGGTVGNQIVLAANSRPGDVLPANLAVAVAAMANGATDPTLTTALANLGDTWFTEIASPYLGADQLGQIEAAGVVRDGAGVNRMFAGFAGYRDTLANFQTFLSTRNSEWTSAVPIHGSPTPAFEIAASVAAGFARSHQATPGRPYKNVTIASALAGLTNDLTYAQRDAIVQAGGSHTYNQADETVTVGDMVTTRTTTAGGSATTDWRFTDIIPNLQYKRYQVENLFRGSPFDRAVVIADGSPPGPSYAVRPSDVKAFAILLVDNWVSLGLSTNRDEIVAEIVAEIDSLNPGRINLLIPDQATAGLRIIAAKIEWSFVV